MITRAVLTIVNVTTSNQLHFECVLCLLSSEQEHREFEAISHVRDSVQMVENAILERDQVCSKDCKKLRYN